MGFVEEGGGMSAIHCNCSSAYREQRGSKNEKPLLLKEERVHIVGLSFNLKMDRSTQKYMLLRFSISGFYSREQIHKFACYIHIICFLHSVWNIPHSHRVNPDGLQWPLCLHSTHVRVCSQRGHTYPPRTHSWAQSCFSLGHTQARDTSYTHRRSAFRKSNPVLSSVSERTQGCNVLSKFRHRSSFLLTRSIPLSVPCLLEARVFKILQLRGGLALAGCTLLAHSWRSCGPSITYLWGLKWSNLYDDKWRVVKFTSRSYRV